MSTLFDAAEVAQAESPDLPPIQGSQRQIEWGTKVRDGKLGSCYTVIRQWRELVSRHTAAGRTEAAGREQAQLSQALQRLGDLEKQASAGWWIDRRDNTALELLTNAEPKPGNELGWSR